MWQFGVLGPLTVVRNGIAVAIEAAMLRRLVAVLLCRTASPVSAAEVIEALWDGAPPPTARKTLQVYVHRLRRILGDDRVDHGPSGYTLLVDESEHDALRFGGLVERARTAHRQARLDQARELFTEALGMWRGPAYADVVTGGLVAQEAARLDEQRLLAEEELVAVELELARYAQVVPRLLGLVGAHPFREGLRGQLMTALYHCGRQAEALEVYRSARALLAEELGVEPTPELQRLHESILRGDLPRPAHRAASANPAPVPRELPRDVWAFTGRRDALAFLDAALPAGLDAASAASAALPAGDAPDVIVISAISGMAGVGKTSLAVHWAHRVAARFPDGQLYVDLRGYAPDGPMRPVEALALLLRALGVAADEVPVDLDRAVRTYRTLLADRRALVVLDNAHDAHQVRPLLPSGPGSLALVTSRDRLTGLVARPGARRLLVDTLPPEDSTALLARVLGEAGVRADPEELAALADACGHLPLALRIAAANIADRADVAGYLDELRGDRALGGLDVDGDPEASVRAAFELSYRTLAPGAQALFRHLGLLPGPDVTAQAAAALVGGSAEGCERLLDALAAAHLVIEHRPGRYALHDLLRHYAREMAQAVDPADARAAAIGRLGDFYVSTVDSAAGSLYPTAVRIPVPAGVAFQDETAAIAWLDAELPNLVAFASHAAAHGPHRHSWLLASGLRGYFSIRRLKNDWLAVSEAGLSAARTAGDQQGIAAGHLGLALAHHTIADLDAAIEHADAALTAATAAGWLEMQASALTTLAGAHAELGRTRTALARLAEADAVVQQLGEPVARARLLINLSTLRHKTGDLRGALRDAKAAVALCEQTGSDRAAAIARCNAAGNHVYLGQYAEAHAQLTAALELLQRFDEPYGRAIAHGLLARLNIETGHHVEALRHANAALADSRAAAVRSIEALVLTDLAMIHTGLGRQRQAMRDAAEALVMAREARSSHAEVQALLTLAETRRHGGRHDEALRDARQALTLATERGYRLLEAEALTTIAAIQLAMGDHGEAAEAALAALPLHEQIGYRLGATRTEALLSSARACTAGAACVHGA